MHIGKSKSDFLCKDLFVGGWKVEVLIDPVTGTCTQSDVFKGNGKKADGTHNKKCQLRRNKGLGVIIQIMQILDSTYFGKYFFEVAMVLRESLFL